MTPDALHHYNTNRLRAVNQVLILQHLVAVTTAARTHGRRPPWTHVSRLDRVTGDTRQCVRQAVTRLEREGLVTTALLRSDDGPKYLHVQATDAGIKLATDAANHRAPVVAMTAG